jgi:hypothetical protein
MTIMRLAFITLGLTSIGAGRGAATFAKAVKKVSILAMKRPTEQPKEASGYNPNILPNPELRREPGSLQILIATTKPIICQTMKEE